MMISVDWDSRHLLLFATLPAILINRFEKIRKLHSFEITVIDLNFIRRSVWKWNIELEYYVKEMAKIEKEKRQYLQKAPYFAEPC